ncbi:hypothetical protein [Breznakiella homolactica]|uniref:Uncharacterized protein n=1 Tax=Breznakiella homolactica TaxID=2798577 RepID=A0A7T7XJL2_9SPIR|nr:hypothetical protein [Breznakiella homolactica]QQO07614.1 hypothetical protein JFL75_11720 [Breznakiella homolactica]
MNREERVKLYALRKEKAKELWHAGIPDLPLANEELILLEEKFRTWSDSFQLNLLEKGFLYVLEKYEILITSTENSQCEHNGQIRTGLDYQNCCGISYEYTNDLSCRTAIEIILRNTAGNKIEKYKERIDSLDKRFKAIPKNDKWIVNQASIEKYEKNGYWWFYGLPLTVKE